MAQHHTQVDPPSIVRVLGKTYKLELVPDFENAGQCFDNKQLIKIATDMPLELEQDSVLHELIHAIDYGMHLEMAERQVSALASGLIALIRDNPSLLHYLSQERAYAGKGK